MAGFPVLHYLPEFAQTPVHWVSDILQYLILCHPVLLLSIFPSIRVFSNELALGIRWPKYWSFSISPSNEYSGLISFTLTGLISLLSKGLSRAFSSTAIWKYRFFCTQPSVWYTKTLTIWTFVSKVMSLLFNTLSRVCHSFFPTSKHL